MTTILLVEDDDVQALALGQLIKSWGYSVVSAPSSMAALDVLESAREIDVILADIVLKPGEPNGLSLVRMAGMRRPDIKAILLTGYRDIAGQDGTMPAKLLYKPVAPEALSVAISEALGGRIRSADTRLSEELVGQHGLRMSPAPLRSRR